MRELDFSPKTVGQRIQDARRRAGLTQPQLDTLCNFKDRSIEGFEQGRPVSDQSLAEIADRLGVHPATLRYGDSVLREAALAEVSASVRRAITELERVAGVLSAGQALDGLVATAELRPSTTQSPHQTEPDLRRELPTPAKQARGRRGGR